MDQLHTMYAQKMSVIADQHDQSCIKQSKDFIKELVESSKEMMDALASSVLSVNENLQKGWHDMYN